VEKLAPWQRFWEAVEDDLNAPRAQAALFDMLKDGSLSREEKAGLVAKMDRWLGLGLLEPRTAKAASSLSAQEEALLEARAKARAEKRWADSDNLREELKKNGILVKDGKEGQSWTKN
jgi:cysteinyl-tRNA synthetase